MRSTSPTSISEATPTSSFSGELHFEIADATRARVRAGRSPGENGITVGHARVGARAHMRVTSRDHWIKFALRGPTGIDCRIADQRLTHTLRSGSMALLPAGADAVAEIDGPMDTLLLRIAAPRVAVCAAERGGRAAALMERLAGRDDALMRLAASLFAEAQADYVNGPLFWNEVSDRIVDHLVDSHLSRAPEAAGGCLAPTMVVRLADYIRAHIADSLEVATLAAIAGVSRYHFTRLFARSVGMTPHRYVTKLRLDKAVALARESRMAPAEIALATGFADQSHLSRWVRRVHGTTLSRLAA